MLTVNLAACFRERFLIVSRQNEYKMKKRTKKLNFIIDASIAGVSRRTVEKIMNAWYESGKAPPKINPELPEEDKERLIQQMSNCLDEEGGDISRRARVVYLGMIYISLTDEGKKNFLITLATQFDVDTVLLEDKIKNLRQAKHDEDRIRAEFEFREALIPPRVKLLRQLITLPDGFIFLKDMRKDLQPLIKSYPHLKKLDDDIKNLLVTYFDINLLDLQEIDWNTPAATLEKLIEYEAVHEISSWDDLKHRLHTDRRVYAFFHYKMPNDPLIFVEVALVNGMPDNIQKLIDIRIAAEDPKTADTAIFYSISNTQKGLTGISFGNFLIKRVVKKLSAELPNLKSFATLSPAPRFLGWLMPYLREGGDPLLSKSEAGKLSPYSKINNPGLGLSEILENKHWHENRELAETVKRPLMRLCAHYLINIKQDLKAYDPVAHFHLSNGARILNMHWMADPSEKGMAQSAGIMLNYDYELKKIVQNHENYLTNHKINTSKRVRAWLK